MERIKNWLYRKILSKSAQEMRKESYDKGYSHGKDELNDKINWVVNQKYSSQNWLVNPDEVLTVDDKGRAFINGKIATNLEIKELQAEAKGLRSFRLYKIIQETLRQKAIEKAVLTSDSTVLRDVNPELMSGKLMIHDLGIIKSIVDLLADYKYLHDAKV